MQMPINDAGIALLHEKEQFVGHAYPDPYSPLGEALQAAGLWKRYLKAAFPIPDEMAGLSGAPWTLGWGFTKGVKEGDTITRVAADQRLALEMDREYVQPIRRACKVEPNENQLAAMTCLAWNIGLPAFLRSTALKCHNRGDFVAASRAFDLFNKARGRVSSGLTQRRRLEGALYLTPVDGHQYAMPQEVEPETRLRSSPIIAGSSISAGAGTVAVIAETTSSVRTIREDLGDWLPWVLVAVAIGAAGWVIVQRFVQRRGGWA